MKLRLRRDGDAEASGTEDKKGAKKAVRVSITDLVVSAFLGAVLICGKEAVANVPFVEIVTPLIMVYSKSLGKKAFAPIYVFVFVELLLYGFGIWWFAYLYVWAILALAGMALKPFDSALLFAVAAAVFGLVFGTLTSIPYFFIGGTKMFIATVVSGLSFDIPHCIGNFALTFVLYRPLTKLMDALMKVRVTF